MAKAQQNEKEMDWFCNLLVRERVASYLEIGSKWGGSLERVARVLPPHSRVVSVDLPHGKRETEPSLIGVWQALRALGYDAHLFLGDSTDERIIKAVQALAPFDACFIDANHTEAYVRADWANYGPMARIVAFHDIGWKARPLGSGKMPIDVPKVWEKIKGDFRHEEIRLQPQDNGIGVLWKS